MRKVVLFNRISIDGFYAGPNGEIDWFLHDPEVDKAAHEMMHPDTLLLGRLTYQMFESYWPHVLADPNASQANLITASELNQMTKVVFSETLQEVSWVNSILIKADVTHAVCKLKQGNGPEITIFGSGSIVQQLVGEGLIDEYLIVMTPIILGTGKMLFKDVKQSTLNLIEVRDFHSGNVLLHYKAVAM
jgi:dihydrofolate reductase